jgi:voltage-gated potassium channel
MSDQPPRTRHLRLIYPRLSIQERAQRAAASGRIILYLAAAIAVLAIATGFIATLVDRKDFPTFGDGIWWAIVTLGTVGYGDIVPHTAWGRVLGGFVIVFGVTFISVLFATVTAFFISAEQEVEAASALDQRSTEQAEIRELLRELASRLTTIETQLKSLQDHPR